MKNIFKSILALVCCGAFLASCEQEVPETEMSVDLTSITAEAQNPEEVAVTLTTNASWLLTCPDWVTPSKTYGVGDAILTFAIATNYKDETTSTRARSGEIKISGGGALTGKGATVIISVNQDGYTYVDPNPSLGGIPDAEEFAAFIVAANTGGSLKRWTSDEANEVKLLADINLADVDIDWQALADVAKAGNENNSSAIADGVLPFEGVFNGDNHKITGFNPVVELGANTTFGLFPVTYNATIKNLELSGTLNVTATGRADAGMLIGTALNSTVSNVKIAGKVVSTGTTASARFSLGGVCGFAYAGTFNDVTGTTLFENCIVDATVEFDGGKNTANGATCAMYGGIVGFGTTPNADAVHKVTIKNCVNNGDMTVKIGSCSGIIATANTGVVLEDVTNNGDQVNTIANGRLGNIVCNISHYCTLKNCVNNGDIDATAEGYNGTVGGIFALAGSATITGIEGGGNYGTIRTVDTGGIANQGKENEVKHKYLGLLWANHNNTFPTKDIVASGRLFIDGVEVEITEANYMEKLGSIKDASCISNILWVAPK